MKYQEKKDLEELLKGKINKYQLKRDSISQAFQVKAQAFEAQAKSLAPAVAQTKDTANWTTRKPTSTTTTHGRRTSYPRRKPYQDGYPTKKR